MSDRFCRLEIMQLDHREFWRRFQTGVEIAVAGSSPDELLGVRDGFLRYLHDGLDSPVSVAVVPHEDGEGRAGLPVGDDQVVAVARRRARALRDQLGPHYSFFVATAAGFHTVELEERLAYFVRSWSVVVGPPGEAWGASGSVQIPERLVAGLENSQLPIAVPATRRRGGIISALTGGLETRRRAVALATFHALSSLMYGLLESRPVRQR